MIGIPLGPFRLTGRIDQGGMGQVWHAVHAGTGVAVAVKLVKDGRPELAEPFLAEMRAVARLDHPHIITVLDCGRVDAAAHAASKTRLPLGSPWMAMEYCSGGTLSAAPPADWEEARGVVVDVLAALAYAHARGVLHRDLTPGNVLLATAEDARPGRKLTDFGLSAPLGRMEPGVIVGTPAYMAPEQLQSELGGQGPWTDLYQLACLTWALCTGTPPFGADRPASVLAMAHLELEPPAFRARFVVPEGLEDWLRTLLVKRPARRIQHAADASLTLQALEGGRVASVGVPASWQRTEPGRIPARLVDAGLGLHALRPVPLVGRKRERDRLWELLREVSATWSPRAVLLHGPAGVGKTRLARWVAERAHELGAAHVLQLEGTDGPEAYWRCQSRHLGRPPEAGEPDDLDTFAPEAALSGAGLHPRVLRMRRFVEGVAIERPVVMVVDDLHANMDAVALAWSLLTDATGTPVLLLLVAGAEGLAEAPAVAQALSGLAGRVEIVRLELGPLAPVEEHELLKDGLGLAAALVHRLTEVTQGNPGMAVAVVGQLADRGALRAEPAGFDAPPGVSIDLPEAVLAPWIARVDRFLASLSAGESAVETLVVAALLGGRVVEGEWLAVCRRLGVAPPVGLVEQLVRARLVVLLEADDDAIHWTFAHGMVREAFRRRVGGAARMVELHRAIASSMDEQVERGTGTVDDARRAAHLFAAGAGSAALDLWLRAVERRAALADWSGVQGVVTAAAAALSALPGAPNDERRLRFEVWRARAGIRGASSLSGAEAIQSAGRLLDRTVEDARGRSWPDALSEALFARAEVHELAGEGRAAAERLQEARGAAWLLGEEVRVAYADLALSKLALRRGDLAGVRGLEEARGLAIRLGDRRLGGEARVVLAQVALAAGQPAIAEGLAREALALAGPRTQRPTTAAALVVLADLERQRGRVEAAVAGYRRALEMFEELGDVEVLTVMGRLGALLLATDRLTDAAEVLDAGRGEALSRGAAGHYAHLSTLALATVAKTGELGEVERLANAATKLPAWGCLSEDVARALSAAVVVFRGRGVGFAARSQEALELACEAWTALGRADEVARLRAG